MLRDAWFHDDDDFGPHEHDDDFGGGAEHGELEPDDTWDFSRVNLTTVGIDIGSTTAHLLFAHITLQASADGSSQRFEVVEREILYRSPILLTPYRADGAIDADALGQFVDAQYAEAELDPDTVDSGAVILTGLALERQNAQAVAEVLSATGGRFVCATAGHRFEALLAAHGSGAVALSSTHADPMLHVDIGGGTTKLALIQHGEIQQTCAIHIGARLVVLDAEQRVERVEPAAELLARHLGVELTPGRALSERDRAALAGLMVEVLLECMRGAEPGPLARELLITERLDLQGGPPPTVTFSGGVSEYIAGRTTHRYGDLGLDMALALTEARTAGVLAAELVELEPGIRATVLGASQFSVQVSGNTISVSSAAILPVRNLPVVAAHVADPWPTPDDVSGALTRALRRLDLESTERTVAVSLSWAGDASYRVLLALARGVHAALPGAGRGESPLVVVVDRDIAGALGSVLTHDLALDGPLVVVDGLDLRELDFVDIGPLVQPANVVPVVVKSLAFGGSAAAH